MLAPEFSPDLEHVAYYPVLCDFGLAKNEVSGNNKPSHGTEYYKSPEHQTDEPLGKSADVWGLGVMFLELAFIVLAKNKLKKMQTKIFPKDSSPRRNPGGIKQCLDEIHNSGNTCGNDVCNVLQKMLEFSPYK